MAAFSYVALARDGKQSKGVMEADSVRHVRQLLRDQSLLPLDVQTAAQNGNASSSGGGFSWGRPSFSVADLALITRQLSTLVQAGIPLEEALGTIAKQSEKARVSSVMMAVRAKVLEGYTLADAMAEFPGGFNELYRSTVAAGESAGHLDAVLDKLADYTESSQASRQKIQMAMIYPAILLIMAIAVVAGLMIAVVPDVVKVFNTQGATLPWITRAMISCSDFLVNSWLLLLIGILVVVLAFRAALKQEGFRLAWHRALLSWPLVGKLVRGTNTAQFASTLSIMTASGVPLVESLKIAGKVLSNTWLRRHVEAATQQVQEGASLNRALAKGSYFPPMMLHMIASGEQSGELDQMLERTAVSQQRDLEALIGIMLGILEPVMLMLMGFCVFVIVLAILLPIVQLNSAF